MGDRDEVCRLRERLEANKSTLEITLELANLTIVSAIKEDTSAIKAELAALKMQVTMRVSGTEAEPNFTLQRFLNDTVAYTESVIDPFECASEVAHTVIAATYAPSKLGNSSEENVEHLDAPRENQNPNQDQGRQYAALKSSQTESSASARPRAHTNPSTLPTPRPAAWGWLVNGLSAEGCLIRQLRDCVQGSSFDRKTALSLIDRGARLENGRLDFGRERLLPKLSVEGLRFLLDHEHSISDEPTALLKYLLTNSFVRRDIAGFLLDHADIHMRVTRSMIAQYHWRQTIGDTISHIDASKPQLDWLIPLLGKSRANANLKNSRGRTPMDIAIDGCEYTTLAHMRLARALRTLGANATYNNDTVRDKAEDHMEWSLYHDYGLAENVASRHDLTFKPPFCFHVTGKCPRTSCAKWQHKVLKENQHLLAAYEDDMVEAVFGTRGGLLSPTVARKLPKESLADPTSSSSSLSSSSSSSSSLEASSDEGNPFEGRVPLRFYWTVARALVWAISS